MLASVSNRRRVEEIEEWKASVRANPPDPPPEFCARFLIRTHEAVCELYALMRTNATDEEYAAFWNRQLMEMSN